MLLNDFIAKKERLIFSARDFVFLQSHWQTERKPEMLSWYMSDSVDLSLTERDDKNPAPAVKCAVHVKKLHLIGRALRH